VMVASAPGCGSMNLVITGGTLYWTERDHGTVNAIPTAGGPLSVIARDQGMPGPIAADATALFWGNDTDKTIMKAARPTGGAAVFAPAGAAGADKVTALLVDRGTLYIGRGRDALKVAVSGGAPTLLMHSPDGAQGRPGAFALDDT
jgi:hypothetical protein